MASTQPEPNKIIPLPRQPQAGRPHKICPSTRPRPHTATLDSRAPIRGAHLTSPYPRLTHSRRAPYPLLPRPATLQTRKLIAHTHSDRKYSRLLLVPPPP
ncbi:hypothetical protein E2562_033061 [Oryza meyeriana var. granulata]|uniref:Uncharacterized protein n=1 Tax=Oryza meyeriana var. granulata TaxID=110450 RepID=A0A6G1DRG0_9ORYZ|nr:hypothetical protein E2562_033061 [Oryza meyeriana var. granulata]